MTVAPPPVTFRAVLGRAAGILRRRAGTLALLALAFSVVPSLLLYASNEPVRRATSPAVDTLEADIFALAVYAAYLGGLVLTRGLALAGEAAIVLVGLETDRPAGPVPTQARRIVLRLIAFSLAALVAGEALYAWLPAPWGLAAYVALNCWTAVVPVCAAERPPLTRLVGRSWAVFARGGRISLSVLALYCVGAACISTAWIHLGDLVGRGTVALWIGTAAVQSVAAAFGTAVDVLMTALYRELHSCERATASTAVVEAFG